MYLPTGKHSQNSFISNWLSLFLLQLSKNFVIQRSYDSFLISSISISPRIPSKFRSKKLNIQLIGSRQCPLNSRCRTLTNNGLAFSKTENIILLWAYILVTWLVVSTLNSIKDMLFSLFFFLFSSLRNCFLFSSLVFFWLVLKLDWTCFLKYWSEGLLSTKYYELTVFVCH